MISHLEVTTSARNHPQYMDNMPNTVADVDAALTRLKGLNLDDDLNDGNAEHPIEIDDFDKISRSIRKTPKKTTPFSFRILPRDEKPRRVLEPISAQSPTRSPTPAAFDSPITVASSIRTVSSINSPRNRKVAAKRRVVCSSDEDDHDDGGNNEAQRKTLPSDLSGEEDQNNEPAKRIARKTAVAKGRDLFIEIESRDFGDNHSEGNEGGYDTPGSLRDFIVDDSVIEYETDASRRDMSLWDPVQLSSDEEQPWQRKGGQREPIVLSSDAGSDESDGEQCIPGPSTPPKKKNAVLSGKSKREWNVLKHQLAANLVRELNEHVFLGRLPDIPIEWSSRLLSTAGRAHRQRLNPGETLPQVRIELAEKILDDEGKCEFKNRPSILH